MNKDRRKTTQFLSELLIHIRLNSPAKYWAKEVSLDYGHGKGIEKRVEYTSNFGTYRKENDTNSNSLHAVK